MLQKGVMSVRGTDVVVYAHAWERACDDALVALGGDGRTVRGLAKYTFDGEADVPTVVWSLNDIWKKGRMWLTWIVGSDGQVYDPSLAHPHTFPPGHRTRELEPFSPLVQTLLERKLRRSTVYHSELLRRFHADAPPPRPLDSTEVKPYCDALLLPLLDVVAHAAAPACFPGGRGLVASDSLSDGDLIAAYPVDVLVGHSPLIREFATALPVMRRCGLPAGPARERSVEQTLDRVRSSPSHAIVAGSSMVSARDGIVAVCGLSAIGDDTLYTAHLARTSDTRWNAIKTTVTTADGGRVVHYILAAARNIDAGEEIVARDDEVVARAEAVALASAVDLAHAPLQQVLAFTRTDLIINMLNV